MNIRNVQQIALQEVDIKGKNQVSGEDFAAVLAEKLAALDARNTTVAGADGQAGAAVFQPLEPVVAPARMPDAVTAQSAATAQRVAALCDDLDAYAAGLGGEPQQGLRAGYDILQKMTRDIATLRSEFPEMERGAPELAAIVNELDVLTTVEVVKLNRGDYL